MSKIFSKLKELPQRSIVSFQQTVEAPAIASSKIKQISIGLILAVLTVAAFFLGSLSSNENKTKNSIILSMDANIRQQQSEILALNKEITAMQSSTKKLKKDMQITLATIDNNVTSKLDQSSMDANRMEANLQTNIDELNTKVSKLQKSMAAATISPKTGNQ